MTDEPTYTAAEVKVLTEEACMVAAEAGRLIGRKEALDTVTEFIKTEIDEFARHESGPYVAGLNRARMIAVNISSYAVDAASDEPAGGSGHQEVSEAARSPQEPCGHPTCPCVQMHSHPEGNTP